MLINAAQPGQAQTGRITAQEESSRPQEARNGAWSRLTLPLGHQYSPCLTPKFQPRRMDNSPTCTWELTKLPGKSWNKKAPPPCPPLPQQVQKQPALGTWATAMNRHQLQPRDRKLRASLTFSSRTPAK